MATEGYVVLTNVFHKEGRKWVAICKELGTATFGHSLTKAEERLQEAVVCHLNTLEDVGERERFFEKHKIRFHHIKPTSDISIRVPVDEDVFIRPHIQKVPAGVAS